MRAVIAQSYERIHRSNLVGMGVAPLELRPGDSAASLGLTGEESFDVLGIEAALAAGSDREVVVRATAGDASREFRAVLRIDTPREADYFTHGGILRYVLRLLLARDRAS